MDLHILFITGAFVMSVATGLVSIPLILDFCRKKALYDIPNSRKVHKNKIPRLGGIAFMPGMLFSFVTAIMMFGEFTGEQKLTVNL